MTTPTSDLFADHAAIQPGDRVLLHGADDPALPRSLARGGAQVDVFDLRHSTLRAVKSASGVTARDTVYSGAANVYDVALVAVPKGRAFGRGLLWDAYRALKPSGRLLVAGANDSGAKSAINDAKALFGMVETLATKRRHRIATAVKPGEPIDLPTTWGDDPTQPIERVYDTPDDDLTVLTMPGVFSWESLDDGTALLLDHLDTDGVQTALDLGCGVGVIGVTLARQGVRVTMSDDNLLAVRCAAATAQHHGLDAVTVTASDVYRDLGDARFDLIASNPPFHQGVSVARQTAEAMLRDAPDHLNPGGRLVIVANAFLPYESLLAAHFETVETVTNDGRYKVLRAWDDVE